MWRHGQNELPSSHQQVLHNRAETEGRKERQRAHDDDDSYEQNGEQGVVTGKVPSDGGTAFLRARLPASASIGMITMKRPRSIASPIVVLYQGVLADRPANADPLLPVPEV